MRIVLRTWTGRAGRWGECVMMRMALLERIPDVVQPQTVLEELAVEKGSTRNQGFTERLRELDAARRDGLLDDEEFAASKSTLLEKMLQMHEKAARANGNEKWVVVRAYNNTYLRRDVDSTSDIVSTLKQGMVLDVVETRVIPNPKYGTASAKPRTPANLTRLRVVAPMQGWANVYAGLAGTEQLQRLAPDDKASEDR